MTTDPERRSKLPPDSVPGAYRQGVITAITVFLGFSLVFLRFWIFEAAGDWTASSVFVASLMTIAVILEIVALWRSLQLEDDDAGEYKKTLRWFLASIVTQLVSLLIAAVTFTEDIT